MKTLKETLKRIPRPVMALGSFVLAAVLVVIVVLQGFIFWLNTQEGGNWVARQASSMMERSGYALELEGFRLSGLFGIKAQHFELRHEGERVAVGQDVALGVNPLPLPLRRLSISLYAKRLEVVQVPDGGEGEEEEEGGGEFEMPQDVYFKSAGIDVHVRALLIGDAVIEGGLEGALRVHQNVTLEEGALAFDGALDFESLTDGQKEGDAALGAVQRYFPARMENEGTFEAAGQRVIFETLQARHDEYDIALEGEYGLQQNLFDVSAEGEWRGGRAEPDGDGAPVAFRAELQGAADDFAGQVGAGTAFKGQDVVMRAALERQGNIVRLTDIVSRGAGAEIKGNVEYDIETALASGTLEGDVADLNIAGKFYPLPENLEGAATFSAELFAENEGQGIDLNADATGMRYGDISAQRITGDVRLVDPQNMEEISGQVSVESLTAQNVEIVRADADITAGAQGYRLDIDGRGQSYHPFEFDALIDVVNGADAAGMQIKIERAALSAGAGRLSAQGQVTNARVDLEFAGRDLILHRMPFAQMPEIPVKVETVSGAINGALDAPEVRANAQVRSTLETAPPAAFTLEAILAQGMLNADMRATESDIERMDGRLRVPVDLSLHPFHFEVHGDEPIAGDLAIDADLAVLSSLFLNAGYEVQGALDVDFQAGGSLNAHRLSGVMSVRDASFVDTYHNFELQNINAQGQMENRVFTLEDFSAGDTQGGALSGNARVDVSDLAAPDIDARLEMDNMHLLQNENYNAWLDGDLNFENQGGGYLLSGQINPQEIVIRLPETFDEKIPELNIVKEEDAAAEQAAPFMERVRLDIAFNADNQIFVSGRGLDAEFQGNLNVDGTLSAPLIKGQLGTVRGRYEEFGRRFDLAKAYLRFQGPVPPSPYLDIEAVTDVEGITASVIMRGSVEDPTLELSSRPALPEDEVLSLILFGKNVEKISPLQALRLANTLRRFSGQGGGRFDPLQEVQDITGLDDIRIEGAGTGDARVGAGKYISDNVYLELEQGKAAGSGAASVEVELTPNVTLESQSTQSGESDVGVFWEWDY